MRLYTKFWNRISALKSMANITRTWLLTSILHTQDWSSLISFGNSCCHQWPPAWIHLRKLVWFATHFHSIYTFYEIPAWTRKRDLCLHSIEVDSHRIFVNMIDIFLSHVFMQAILWINKTKVKISRNLFFQCFKLRTLWYKGYPSILTVKLEATFYWPQFSLYICNVHRNKSIKIALYGPELSKQVHLLSYRWVSCGIWGSKWISNTPLVSSLSASQSSIWLQFKIQSWNRSAIHFSQKGPCMSIGTRGPSFIRLTSFSRHSYQWERSDTRCTSKEAY